MNERFFRCTHCGLPHEERAQICPRTGKPIERKSSRALSTTRQNPLKAPVQPRRAPAVRAPPPSSPSITTGTSVPTMRRQLIGKTIGDKYKIKAVLGEGGMGTVFEAINVPLGRLVALKILHTSQLKKKDAVKRFHKEARAAGAIGHPNICEVYDLGTLADGCPYLVMERLVGETLADRIANEGGLPFGEVVDVMIQVLSGLHAAHEKGIIHRDIKPENVFLTKRVGCPPVAKLLDFGVSKMMSHLPQDKDDSDLELTRTGIVLGTPYYLAPEQARGDRNLDARVDLYACGVMFYEALTGKRPFTAANYNALLINILTGSPRPVRELRPSLPRDFDRVLDKAMAREPYNRYQSATDFQADLQAISGRAQGEPSVIVAMPTQPDIPERAPVRTSDRKVPSSRRPAMTPRSAADYARGRETLLRALPVDPLRRFERSSDHRMAVARQFAPTPAAAPPRVPTGGLRPAPATAGVPPPPTTTTLDLDIVELAESSEYTGQVPAGAKPAGRVAADPPPAPPPTLPASAAARQRLHRRSAEFDDLPTEVQRPKLPSDFELADDDGEGDEKTRLMGEREIARLVNTGTPPPRPAAGRPPSQRPPLPAKPNFENHSATDVMTPELKELLNRPHRPSPPRGPEPPLTPSRRSRR